MKRNLKRRVVCLLALAVVAGCLPEVFAGTYSWYDYGGNQYALTFGAGSWDDMRLEASNAGGDLVVINDPAENAWLINTFMGSDNTMAWIGLYQNTNSPDYSEPLGGWEWVNGAPLTYSDWWTTEKGAIYGDNPSNSNGLEDWASLCYKESNGKTYWNDYSEVWGDIPGIIEIDNTPAPTPPAVPVPGAVLLAALGAGTAGWLRRKQLA